MARITIDSILGGHSPTTHFATKDQFRASLGIDPSQPITDTTTSAMFTASGLLRPTRVESIGTTTMSFPPMWMVNHPKGTGVFGETIVYDLQGSAFLITFGPDTVTALSDHGSLSNSSGNGCAYYDNYIYFAKNTDVARYGPLDGSAVFNATYWTSTLGKAALTNSTYPTDAFIRIPYPNHVMHRHSDGKLYFADVVGNQGTIHVISTTKNTVEGDTDNGSKANALTFGYGLFPTAIESYGTSIAVALYEGPVALLHSSKVLPAKLAFWDTTSSNFNSIIFVEFPDPIITALKNVNGTLYIISGNTELPGFRVSRYIGGSSIQEIGYFETGEAPYPGAVDGAAGNLVLGTYTNTPESAAVLYSLGLQKEALGKGLFSVTRSSAVATTIAPASVTAISPSYNGFGQNSWLLAWTNGGLVAGVDVPFNGTYDTAPSVFWSQQYNIGQPFQIKRIRIPLAQQLAANMTVTAKLYFDNGTQTQTLTTINSTNFPSTGPGAGMVANIKTAGDGSSILMGQNNFWLELRWTGSALCVVDLPILIDFELIPD